MATAGGGKAGGGGGIDAPKASGSFAQPKPEEPKKDLPNTAVNYEADACAGREGADKDSYAIPFLLVLQPLSPQVVDKLVPGAEAGMLLNSVTNELYKEGADLEARAWLGEPNASADKKCPQRCGSWRAVRTLGKRHPAAGMRMPLPARNGC